MMGLFARELEFTKVFQSNAGLHPAVREARCLRQQLMAGLREIGPAYAFAGRVEHAQVGFGCEEANGGPNYYCWRDRIMSRLNAVDISTVERREVLDMLEFWKTETTLAGKLYGPIHGTELGTAVQNAITGAFGRLSGPLLDFDKLLKAGASWPAAGGRGGIKIRQRPGRRRRPGAV